MQLCYPDPDGIHRPVHVPENLFVIGTMNIADRSLRWWTWPSAAARAVDPGHVLQNQPIRPAMALPNLWGLYNLRSSPFFQATLRADSDATPLRLFVGQLPPGGGRPARNRQNHPGADGEGRCPGGGGLELR